MRFVSSQAVHVGFRVAWLGCESLLQGDGAVTRPGITIFILFFGLATLEAITDGRWPRVAFWLLMAGVFAWLDRWGRRRTAGT